MLSIHMYKMDCQDWETVTIRKKPIHKPSVVKVTSESAQANKFMANDIVKAKQLSKESIKELISRRTLQKMTQAELNQKCQFPIHTINRLESGQISPSISQLNTLNRVLKAGLKYEHS